MDLNNPHANFVAQNMSDLAIAKEVLQAFVPPAMANAMDWNTLKLEKDSFVTEELKELYLDMLFSCKLKEGEKIQFYFLFEHKSHPDYGAPDQLLRYLSQIHTSQKEKVPVIPVLFYHGRENWNIKSSYKENFNIPEDSFIQNYVLNFQYILISLNSALLDKLQVSIRTKAFLKILTIWELDIKKLEQYLQEIAPLFFVDDGIEFLYTLFRYIYGTSNIQPEEAKKVVKRIAAGKEEIAMTTAELLIKQGKAEGKAEGRAQGRIEGRIEGEKKAKLETARRMKAKGYSVEDILSLTGLAKNDLKENGLL
ncbi:MAG: Rpn family recombination-promoting nuclease/putative transposase [Candidatus Hydrogenedentota bacterium]|nr:MAG: Rpn family recombination-promoting nuclease/putative transposase [Candidatus Hydrogenedentota bacterium]